jgi:hypothetical protein
MGQLDLYTNRSIRKNGLFRGRLYSRRPHHSVTGAENIVRKILDTTEKGKGNHNLNLNLILEQSIFFERPLTLPLRLSYSTN